MTYHKLIELYKKNMLEEEQKKNLEIDIEKHEAISDYLFDKEELGDWNESQAMHLDIDQDNTSDQENLTLRIQKSIRNTFLKMGITIGIVVVALMLFVMFALPEIVNSFYYNPGKDIGSGTNQMSLDMSVYTELFIPGYNRENVIVDERGYGDYDVTVVQNMTLNGMMTNVSGKIEKNNLHFYNENILNRPAGNCFACFQMPEKALSTGKLSDIYDKSSDTFFSAAGTVEQATETLNNLNEYDKYVAYATLNQFMTYEEFIDYLNKSENINNLSDIWCAVCTSPNITLYDTGDGVTSSNAEGNTISDQELFRPSNIGFNCTRSSSTNLSWDKEKYPSLRLWDNATLSELNGWDNMDQLISEQDFMKTHFVSMLNYMSEQKEFMKMMGEDTQILKDASAYVDENGLIIYGFACVADKKTLLDLNAQDEVFEIYTQVLQ